MIVSVRHLLWPLILIIAVFANLASAQTDPASDELPSGWTATAARAESVIQSGRASNVALDSLRRVLAQYREEFLSDRDQNKQQIKALEAQLNALGPAPAEGAEEPPAIADLRKSLTDQLGEAKAPGLIANEAYYRANGLIAEIDRIIRERRTAVLLSRGPSPLNMSYWPEAWQDLSGLGAATIREIRQNLTSQADRANMLAKAPMIGGLVLVGLLLLIRSGTWSERLLGFLRSFGGHGSGIWTFVVSLSRIALPFAGIVALCKAAALTGLFGLRGSMLLSAIPLWGATILTFKWLADQLYSEPSGDDLVPVAKSGKTEAWYLVVLLGVLLVISSGMALFERLEDSTDATRAVIGFPPVLITALVLVRLQRVGMRLREAADTETEDGTSQIGVQKFSHVVRRGIVLLALAAPLLSLFGYTYAAETIISSAVLTLAVVSGVLILQRFIGDLYGWLSGRGETGRDSLFSVLVGFLLALASLPVLALVWGARVSDLTEIWTRFLEGFQIGDSRISPTDFLVFVLVFLIGYGLTRLLQSGLRNSLLPKTRIDPGGQNAIVAGTGYIGIFLAGLAAVAGAGLDLSSLAIVAGALSVGIGFGLQTIVSNFVSGIILLVERPVSKGDWIEVGGQMGYVRDISVRATRIETFDRTDVIVPNSDLISGQVTNYTRGKTIGRVIVPVGVAYGTDTRKVEEILKEIANEHPMVLANPAPTIVFQGFGADSLDFEIRAILRDVNWVLSVKSDMNHDIARRFGEEGIEIPFSQRDIWLRNPEVLRAADAEAD